MNGTVVEPYQEDGLVIPSRLRDINMEDEADTFRGDDVPEEVDVGLNPEVFLHYSQNVERGDISSIIEVDETGFSEEDAVTFPSSDEVWADDDDTDEDASADSSDAI